MALSSKVLVLLIVVIFLSVFVAGVSIGTNVDSVPPSIVIKTPTKESNFTTNLKTITVAGSAYDSVKLAGVSWKNNATGKSGNCTGSTDLTTWQTPSIDLHEGKNRIDVRAWDTSGNLQYAILVVYSDQTNPNCTIAGPTKDSEYRTYTKNATLSGKAYDQGKAYPGFGIASVEWTNAANGDSGNATIGLDNDWLINKIALVIGDNLITVKAIDSSGNYGTDHITITRVA